MKGRFPQRVRLDTMGEPDFGAACALEPNATEACCIAALRGSCLLDLIGTASAAHRDRAAFYGGVGEDGLEAVSLWRQHRARLCCILMDVNMPRMNGIDATKYVDNVV